jgi:hypothetical protein
MFRIKASYSNRTPGRNNRENNLLKLQAKDFLEIFHDLRGKQLKSRTNYICYHKTADKMVRTCSKHLKHFILDKVPVNCPHTENV